MSFYSCGILQKKCITAFEGRGREGSMQRLDGIKQANGKLGAAVFFGSVLVVGVLLGGRRDAVLALGGAGPESVQPPAVLSVVDVVFEKQLRRKKNGITSYGGTFSIIVVHVITAYLSGGNKS